MERVLIASPQCCIHPGLGALGTVANFLHGTGLRESVTYIAMVYLVSRMRCNGLNQVGFCGPCDAMTTRASVFQRWGAM
jgi:hypothetical protein